MNSKVLDLIARYRDVRATNRRDMINIDEARAMQRDPNFKPTAPRGRPRVLRESRTAMPGPKPGLTARERAARNDLIVASPLDAHELADFYDLDPKTIRDIWRRAGRVGPRSRG